MTEEIENFIYKHSSPNGCVALTRMERDELFDMIEQFQISYNKLNDFSNSQCAKLLKENQELKAELEKEKRHSLNVQKICFDSCL
ncbi:MAG: hypothetical protein MJ181_10715 [Treponema sp.]|nr:hypothetical protein [Treponema sp.]